MATKKGLPSNDLTTQVLVQIRDEIRVMRGDIHEMRGDIHQMKGDIRQMKGDIGGLRHDVDRLERRQSEDTTRLATELISVAQAVVQVRDLLREGRVSRERIEDHEHRICALEKRSA